MCCVVAVKDLLEAELKDMEVERLRLFEENATLKSDKERLVTENGQLAANSSQSVSFTVISHLIIIVM